LEVCHDLKKQVEDDPDFLSKVNTGDEIKMTLKEQRFNDVEEIQAESQATLDAVHKEEFQKCFHKWENCWNRFITVQGEYS
jgi:dipeptidase